MTSTVVMSKHKNKTKTTNKKSDTTHKLLMILVHFLLSSLVRNKINCINLDCSFQLVSIVIKTYEATTTDKIQTISIMP